MEVCGVSFKENGKVYYFNRNNIDVKKDDYVIVETERGEQLGKTVFIENRENEKPTKNVLRIANKSEFKKYLDSLKEAKDALDDSRKFAQELSLNMQFIDAFFTFDRSQLVINFVADERIDFRELVKKIAAKYKTRIELHQMGIRDKAKENGGLGPCGRQLCCNCFLNKMDTISINMAKNQGISLNPTKMNGSCGRLLCCLAYEDDVYTSYRNILPQVGDMVKYKGKRCKVQELNILNHSYYVDIDGEMEEVVVNE